MEDKDFVVQEETTQEILEPIGVRVIGEVDPRFLSEEQFRTSPDLLYHGAQENFTFSNQFDYRSADYYEKSDGTQTLGEGFYTTAERESAENYSLVRQAVQEAVPIIVEVLPYQAKVLDLRAKSDPTRNAPVPRDFFAKWVERFTKSYKEDNAAKKDRPWYVNEQEGRYFDYLINLQQKMPDVDLRVMLGTAIANVPGIKNLDWRSPPWAKMFSNFCVEQGYDGVVYNEGGEGKKGECHTSYVFYNLEKIGTFDSWHASEKLTDTNGENSKQFDTAS